MACEVNHLGACKTKWVLIECGSKKWVLVLKVWKALKCIHSDLKQWFPNFTAPGLTFKNDIGLQCWNPNGIMRSQLWGCVNLWEWKKLKTTRLDEGKASGVPFHVPGDCATVPLRFLAIVLKQLSLVAGKCWIPLLCCDPPNFTKKKKCSTLPATLFTMVGSPSEHWLSSTLIG